MGLVIAAPASGSGKTLLSLCLVAAVARRGLSLQSFKVGPDYLDPQLLSAASGRPCRNLDRLLCGKAWPELAYRHWGGQTDLTLVEGVMGLFDGQGPTPEGSTACIAEQLGLPILFIVDARRQGHSLVALVQGFRAMAPQLRWAGVVLNGVGSARHRQLLEQSLAGIGLPLLGSLPRADALELPCRHLGLLTPRELADFSVRLDAMASHAERHLDLERLLPLLTAPRQQSEVEPYGRLLASPGTGTPSGDRSRASSAPRGEVAMAPPPDTLRRPLICVAADQAFHFHYPELFEWCEILGAEVLRWSPLADEDLPAACAAVVLPGGYPELHAEQLSQAERSLQALRRHCGQRRPLLAECGGMLLLGESLRDGEDRSWPMAGLLPFSAGRGALSLGYRQARVARDALTVRQGEQLRGHEFHRWQLLPPAGIAGYEPHGALWHLEGWGVSARHEGFASQWLQASWLHLHWSGCPQVPRRLIAAASCRSAATAGRPG